MDRTVTIKILGKPQVFTLYVNNPVVGRGAYLTENKYGTLPKKVAVYVTKIYHSFAERFVIGEKYDWNKSDTNVLTLAQGVTKSKLWKNFCQTKTILLV